MMGSGPVIAFSFSDEVGGPSALSAEKVLQQSGAEVKRVDYREIGPQYKEEASKNKKARYARDDEVAKDPDLMMEMFEESREAAKKALENVDSLVIPGNSDMLHPGLYGQDREEGQTTDLRRSIAELAMIDVAVNKGMPILGICGGHQLINVYFGGDLKPLASYQTKDQRIMQYAPVLINSKSTILGKSLYRGAENREELQKRIKAFGAHYEAINKLGGKGTIDSKHESDRLKVAAISADGSSVEAVESTTGAPIVGTQFHPEVTLEGFQAPGGKAYKYKKDREANQDIFDALITAGEAYRRKKLVLQELKSRGVEKERVVLDKKSTFRKKDVPKKDKLSKDSTNKSKNFIVRLLNKIYDLYKKFVVSRVAKVVTSANVAKMKKKEMKQVDSKQESPSQEAVRKKRNHFTTMLTKRRGEQGKESSRMK